MRFGSTEDETPTGRHRSRRDSGGSWLTRRLGGAVRDQPTAPEPAVLPTPARDRATPPPIRRAPPLAGEPELVQRVNPLELSVPVGYAHATVARGQAVFLAGQLGTNHQGRLVDTGLVPQFDRALQNVLLALAAAGGTAEHLASLTVYCTDIVSYQEHTKPLGAVWRARIGAGYPAMSVVEVRRLWEPEALVELQGYAVIP